MRELEDVLQKANVERQTYHGKSFVGNHVNRRLGANSLYISRYNTNY